MLIKLEQKIKELNQIVIEKWWENIIPKFDIDFSLSSSSKLGSVVYRKKWIDLEIPIMKLNKDLLYEFKDLYIRDVVIHEYAHLVVYKLFPNRYNWNKKVMPHWKEFKAVCSYFWIDWSSTTSTFRNSEVLKKKKNKIKKWTYKCDCSIHEVSTQRHNKIQRWIKYVCRKCHWYLRK